MRKKKSQVIEGRQYLLLRSVLVHRRIDTVQKLLRTNSQWDHSRFEDIRPRNHCVPVKTIKNAQDRVADALDVISAWDPGIPCQVLLSSAKQAVSCLKYGM